MIDSGISGLGAHEGEEMVRSCSGESVRGSRRTTRSLAGNKLRTRIFKEKANTHLQRHDAPPTKGPSTPNPTNLRPIKRQHTHSQTTIHPEQLVHGHVIRHDPRNPAEHTQRREDVPGQEERKKLSTWAYFLAVQARLEEHKMTYYT